MKTIVHPWVQVFGSTDNSDVGHRQFVRVQGERSANRRYRVSRVRIFLICVIADEIVAGVYLLFPSKRRQRARFSF